MVVDAHCLFFFMILDMFPVNSPFALLSCMSGLTLNDSSKALALSCVANSLCGMEAPSPRVASALLLPLRSFLHPITGDVAKIRLSRKPSKTCPPIYGRKNAMLPKTLTRESTKTILQRPTLARHPRTSDLADTKALRSSTMFRERH